MAAVFLLAARLYFVQIIHGDAFAKQAEAQYVSTESLFDRGSIFFLRKDGTRTPAATVAGGYVLAIHPIRIKDPEGLYHKLSSVVELDRETFISLAEDIEDPYDEVAHKLSLDQKEEIEALDLKEVSIHREYWRVYPGDDVAADTLGFVAYEDDKLGGQYGLERYYEDILSRNDGGLYVNFFAEIFSQIDIALSSDVPQHKGDVILTIEPSVQRMLEEELDEVRAEWGSKKTAGVIIDPVTGAIYAMAERPAFSLNNFNKAEDISVFSNSLVESVYEMGSIIKPLTVSAGLDAGVITAQTTYEDRGTVTLNGRTISNYDGRARGVVSMQEVLSQSLNTGVTNIMLRLGTKRFGGYMRSFGLGEKTDIDLPNEVAGLIGNLSSPREIEYATASFGQGVALTPIATTRALAALANGGTLVRPHVVSEIEYDLGHSKIIEPESGRRVIKEETSEEITRMLVKVVDEALLGGTVALDNHSIAAKTGTAQIARDGGAGYYDDRFLHSFFGYFPAFEPRFLIFLMNVGPHGAKYASQTLTSPFMDLTQFLIQYYEIPPDR